MIKKRIEILSTKLLDEAIVKQAASENIIIDCIKFIDIRPIDTSGIQQQIKGELAKNHYVIFTSANAVNAVAEQLSGRSDLKIFCISGKTRKAVEEHFPGSIIVDDAPNGSELAAKIIARQISSAVFFCGDKRLDTIPDMLSEKNIHLKEVVVYETVLAPQKIDKGYDGILFFSPSAVESLFKMNNVAQCPVAFSFAASTFNTLKSKVDEIVVSKIPSEQAMLNTVIEYYKSKHK